MSPLAPLSMAEKNAYWQDRSEKEFQKLSFSGWCVKQDYGTHRAMHLPYRLVTW